MNRKGLEGLKGLDFSTPEGQAWVEKQKRAGVVTSSWKPSDIKQLYRNQQFIDKYGIDTFNSMINDPAGRSRVYEEDIINKAFYDAFNPFFDNDENKKGVNGELYDASKGMGRDFFKYNIMSPASKKKLLESGWLTNSEIDAKIKEDQSDRAEMIKEKHKYLITHNEGEDAFSYYFLAKDLEESINRGKNDKLIERIFNEDLKNKRNELTPEVDQYYINTFFDENGKAKISDDEVNELFMKANKPKEGEGAAYIFSAYFNDDGTSSESETEQFSIDDKRRFLARKAVYDYYLGPEAGYDALNNQCKEYINDHQAWYTYCGLLAKDIGISVASYTADKWNSIRRLTLLGQDSDVYITNDGQVVPTVDVKMDGDQAFYEKDGQRIPVHKQTLSLIALDDMGKDGNGEDRSKFNNAQFWTNAEQFGTMDEEELAQYKKLGYSPHKVVYKPGDESDIWYESIKMTSFALADMLSNLSPAAGATLGAKLTSLAARSTGMMSKAMSYAGKGLYYASKGVQKANPLVGAAAIGNAYGRGVFGETFTGNLQKLEQSVADQAQKEVYNLYNTDKEYKAEMDAEIEQEYQNLMSQYKQQIKQQNSATTEGGPVYFDNSNIPEFQESMRSQALMNVLNRKTTEWGENYKNGDMYGMALQTAAESASDAALTSSITTAAKYTVVNYGWRKFLFKTPSELTSSYKKGTLKDVNEITNSAGKKRLTSKFDFLTSGGKTKELAKTVGTQWWGGAWTNATDELQSAGGRRINEDRMSQFISGMYNGKALEARYSIMDGVASYFHGAASGLADERTYIAGLVGGMGSGTSFAPNLTSLVTTKNFRQTWKNSNFGEKMNMVLANGILNNYYAKKYGQLQAKASVDLINRMLDETNDFEAIDQAIALDMASIDATNPEDANALSFLKAVQAIDMLNNFKEDKEAAKIGQESTVMQKAMATVEKLTNPSKLTQEEAADFLSQYYAENPGIPQSEGQSQLALIEMQERAVRLKEASETYADIENTLGQVEKSRGTRLPNQVRARLVQRLTLDKFLTDRTAELEKKITGTNIPSDAESTIASYGTVEHQEAQVRAVDHLIRGIEKEINNAENRVSEAQRDMEEYNSTPQNDQGLVRKKKLQEALDNARIQVEHLNNIKRGLTLQLDRFSEQVANMWDMEGNVVGTRTKAKVTDQILSADEILRLNPQDRARMLDKANYDKYSDAQKAEIDKLKNQLVMQDPTILDDIQNQANLTQRIEANRRAYAMMLENPEAAAYQLDSDMARQALEARTIYIDRTAAKIADSLHKFSQQANIKGDDVDATSNAIYRNLRVLNRDILEYMNDEEVSIGLGIGHMFKEIQDALDWSNMTSDISNIIDSMEMGDAQKNAFTTSLDAILDKTNSKTEVLDELGKVVESKDVDASAKAPFEKLLNELEQLWDQRASTVTLSREEREAAAEENRKKLGEENQRKIEAEKAARAEAERKAAEAAANGITDTDADTSGDRDAELAAQGLTDKDTTTNNESTLTPEQIAKAVEEGEDVNLDSPTLEEQAATTPDKVDIIPVPKDDSTDQGNILPESNSTLIGNSMYRYELDPLKEHGKQVARQGGKNADGTPDKMSRYFNWMESAGIKLQDIIDEELSEIAKLDKEVYPLFVKVERNATNDDAMADFPLLVVEYTNDVASIHNDKNGGVLTSEGKQYLVIGTLGFPKGTGRGPQGAMLRDILNKSPRKPFFDANPSERFYVNRNKHTKIQSISSGRLVRQLTTDSEVQIRTISELLSDEARNPKGLTMGDLKWGIQYDNRLATVNVSDRNIVYPPSDGASNLGSVFLLVESSNGNYLLAYIRPIRLTELNDSGLKTQLNNLINELTSTDYNRRLASIKQLVQFLNLTQKGDNILIGTKEKPTVSIVSGGVVTRTFNLADANFDRQRFLESIAELNPRVNITTSTLSDVALLEMFDEAGALTTDLAKLGTSGASYNVYGMDADGNPIITAPVENPTPTLEAGSDLAKAQRKMSSERMGNATYRKDANGNWHTETDKLVTDPRLTEQLNYRNLIRTRDLKPSKVIGMDEVFIINSDIDSPLVLVRRRGNQIFAMSKEGAVKTINEVNAELAKKARQERLQKELEAEASNDEFLRTMPDEDRRRVAAEGNNVDLGLGETITEEQLLDQMIGNFETEATPQQKTAEELVDRINSDTADMHLEEDSNNPWSAAVRAGILPDTAAIPGLITSNYNDSRDGGKLTPVQAKYIMLSIRRVLSTTGEDRVSMHNAVVSEAHHTKANIPALNFLYKLQNAVYEGKITVDEAMSIVDRMIHKENPSTSVVESKPIRTGEDINKTGTKSLAELQSKKTVDSALSIIKSNEFGKRARTLLKTKFPDMPSKVAELERFLQSKGIATTGITDVEQWLKMIEECK